MFTKFLFGVTSAICLLSSLVNAQDCIYLNSTAIGNSIGTNYTDFDFLKANQDPSFYYRLSTMQLCTNSANTLTGMRAIIAKIVASTNQTGSQIPLNRFGAVTDTGITCTNFTLDYQNSEYVQSMTVFYTTQVITKVILTSSQGRTLSRGLTVSSAASQTFTFTQDQQLLALWGTGTRGTNFTSIGTVIVQESCREQSVSVAKNKALAIGIGIGVGVGVPVIIIILVIIIFVLKRQSSKANSEIQLTDKNIPAHKGSNKIVPNADFEDGKHTALGDFKPNDPSLTSANMLTNPDMTTDEQTAKNSKDQPKKFKNGPANNQSKK